jgi:hypothetical protein
LLEGYAGLTFDHGDGDEDEDVSDGAEDDKEGVNDDQEEEDAARDGPGVDLTKPFRPKRLKLEFVEFI